jgi:hypothetical protein
VELRRVAVVSTSKPAAEIEPLVVKPRVAWKLLSCGNTRGYQLLQSGELESFLDGGSRKITMASIRRYIELRLQQQSSLRRKGTDQQTNNRRLI